MTRRTPAASSSPEAVPDRLDRPFLDPLFDRLFPRLATGVEWGLERTRAALAELGDPHLGRPAIHVGGTNGKGSVSATCASILRSRGHRVGLYTSPHLCSLAERFQVDGAPVSDERLLATGDRVRATVERHGLTFFEAATVLAFQLFHDEEAEVQVLEVGLGGRLDATNVIRPLVSVLTNVAMDHADFLGDTLGAIAGEKAGILKTGVPAVTAESGAEALSVFRREARRLEVDLEELDPARDISHVEVARDHTAFTLAVDGAPERFRTPLVGEHQAVNAALTVRALRRLPVPFRPTVEEIRTGMARVVWPGRDQIREVGGVCWLLDVAHNTAGVRSLTGVLDELSLPEPHVALVGVLGDKAWDEMLPPLLERMEHTFLTQPESAPENRRWDPWEAARRAVEAAPSTGRSDVEVIVDFHGALEAARTRAAGGTVVVTGSCHTVGDALRLLHLDPFASPSPESVPLPSGQA